MLAGHLYIAPLGSHLAVANDSTLFSPARREFTFPVLGQRALQQLGRDFQAALAGRRADWLRHRLRDGINLVKAMEGCVIVQDERSSAIFDMPAAAIRTGSADLSLTAGEDCPALIALTMAPGAANLLVSGPQRNLFPDSRPSLALAAK